jgi:hypothetical protein
MAQMYWIQTMKYFGQKQNTLMFRSIFDMYMSYRPVISYDLAHRIYTVPSSWRHTMNKKQKLSSVAHYKYGRYQHWCR